MSDCSAPLPIGDLLDWWLGDLDETRSDEVEDHFFGCEACTARLDGLRELGAGVVALSRVGAMPLASTTALLNRMSRDRRVLRQYSARPGQVISCTVSHDDEWLVSRLRADFEDADRVDLEISQGEEIVGVLEDVVVDRSVGEVVALMPAQWAAQLATEPLRVRLRSGEKLLGEYVFDHTNPDPPG